MSVFESLRSSSRSDFLSTPPRKQVAKQTIMKSNFVGVEWNEFTGKWKAVRIVDGKAWYGGSFLEEERAAKASDGIVLKHGKENFPGKLNFPDQAKITLPLKRVSEGPDPAKKRRKIIQPTSKSSPVVNEGKLPFFSWTNILATPTSISPMKVEPKHDEADHNESFPKSSPVSVEDCLDLLAPDPPSTKDSRLKKKLEKPICEYCRAQSSQPNLFMSATSPGVRICAQCFTFEVMHLQLASKPEAPPETPAILDRSQEKPGAMLEESLGPVWPKDSEDIAADITSLKSFWTKIPQETAPLVPFDVTFPGLDPRSQKDPAGPFRTRSGNISTVNKNDLNVSTKKPQSPYVGVSLYISKRQKCKWVAQIKAHGKSRFIGYFACDVEAAKAVNQACLEVGVPMKNPALGLPETSAIRAPLIMHDNMEDYEDDSQSEHSAWQMDSTLQDSVQNRTMNTTATSVDAEASFDNNTEQIEPPCKFEPTEATKATSWRDKLRQKKKTAITSKPSHESKLKKMPKKSARLKPKKEPVDALYLPSKVFVANSIEKHKKTPAKKTQFFVSWKNKSSPEDVPHFTWETREKLQQVAAKLLKDYEEKNHLNTQDDWSKCKKKAFEQKHKQPNAFHYRHNLPGEEPKTGPWSKEEMTLFMQTLKKTGANHKWGIFSMNIPGRVGYACAQFYRKLVLKGWIWDKNYWFHDNKVKLLKRKLWKDDCKFDWAHHIRYSFIVVRDLSGTFCEAGALGFHENASDEFVKRFSKNSKLKKICKEMAIRHATYEDFLNDKGKTTIILSRKSYNQVSKFPDEISGKKKTKKRASKKKGKNGSQKARKSKAQITLAGGRDRLLISNEPFECML